VRPEHTALAGAADELGDRSVAILSFLFGEEVE
jgi:hypothetical protein